VDDKERAMIRTLFELQMELFDHQGDEIAALRKANESLQRSHEVVGKMLALMAEFRGLF
jgi:hypothetical protein